MSLPVQEIIKPLCGLAGLTVAVWIKLFRDRFAEIDARKITPEWVDRASKVFLCVFWRRLTFALRQFTGPNRVVLVNVNASDNFKNLFEASLSRFQSPLSAV